VPSDGSDNRNNINNNNRNAAIRVCHGKIVEQLARYPIIIHWSEPVEFFHESILIGEKSRVKKELQWEIARGKELSDETIRSAQMIAQDWVEWLEQDVWQHFDALALPTAQLWPFDVSLDYPHIIDSVPMDTYHRWMQTWSRPAWPDCP
jgi:Asp-tRNA(Asn)/Glu-tRNA(Gln) amidotransferase A subunit family amidase